MAGIRRLAAILAADVAVYCLSGAASASQFFRLRPADRSQLFSNSGLRQIG
jgi:hypothetical protein